jgi:hypothetical protein
MSGKSPLKSGAPRLLGNHGGVEGKAYRRAYDSLEQEFGAFRNDFVRYEAGRVAVARIQFERSTRELVLAQRKRRVAKGRRPNERMIERMARRQGLADMTYSAAVKRFEDIVKRAGGSDLARALAAALKERNP